MSACYANRSQLVGFFFCLCITLFCSAKASSFMKSYLMIPAFLSFLLVISLQIRLWYWDPVAYCLWFISSIFYFEIFILTYRYLWFHIVIQYYIVTGFPKQISCFYFNLRLTVPRVNFWRCAQGSLLIRPREPWDSVQEVKASALYATDHALQNNFKRNYFIYFQYDSQTNRHFHII